MIVEIKKAKISKSLIEQSEFAHHDTMLSCEVLGWVNVKSKRGHDKMILFYSEFNNRIWKTYYPDSITRQQQNDKYFVRFKYRGYVSASTPTDSGTAGNLMRQLEEMVKTADMKGQIYY